MQGSRRYWILSAVFLGCVAGSLAMDADWLLAIAFVLAFTIGWSALRHQWKRISG
jgi:hypothetical protein